MNVEYLGFKSLNESEMLLEGVANCSIGEQVSVICNGKKLLGEIISFYDRNALVKLYDSACGFEGNKTKSILSGNSRIVNLGQGMLGRRFDSVGRAIDGLGKICSDEENALCGSPLNPAMLEYSCETVASFQIKKEKIEIQNGCSQALFCNFDRDFSDALNELFCNLDNVVIVLAEICVSKELSRLAEDKLIRCGLYDKSVIFSNNAENTRDVKFTTLQSAVTAANYFAFDRGCRTLILTLDMTDAAVEYAPFIAGHIGKQRDSEGSVSSLSVFSNTSEKFIENISNYFDFCVKA